MPEIPVPVHVDFSCAICGHETTDLEEVQGWPVCVDLLGCIARGLVSAKKLRGLEEARQLVQLALDLYGVENRSE